MFGFGLQIFGLVTVGLTILLAAYAVYVRVRSSVYTERRFSFVALWTCVTIVSAAILSISDLQPLSIAASLIGIKLEITTFPEKALIVVLAAIYCAIVRSWALSWNGLLTEQGKKNQDRDKPQPFMRIGLEETIRLLRREASPSLATTVKSGNTKLALSAPVDQLPLHGQIKLLIEAKWPEYEFAETDWVGRASCWLGKDRAYNQPVIAVCVEAARDIDFGALNELLDNVPTSSRSRILVIARRLEVASENEVRDKLKPRAIEILQLDHLVATVANFDEYKRRIQDEFKVRRLPDASFAIADILAPTRVRRGLTPSKLKLEDIEEDEDLEKESDPPLDFIELVTAWMKDRTSTKHIALLGKYGQGKSTAALALTHSLLFDAALRAECDDRIPILIRLTGRSPSTTRLAELLGAWGAQYNLSGQVLLALHRAGRLLLIFDAFDEMAYVTDRTARFEHFDALWEFASFGAKLLFTGRPNFFLDDEELKEVLGISKNVAVGPYCEAVRLAPFDILQIEKAVSWLGEEKRLPLVEAIKKLRSLRKVCCRPSLLYLIAHLWDRERLDLQNASVSSANIVREFITYSFERQVQKQKDDAARRPDRQFLNLTKNELDYFTCGIAVACLSEGRQNSIAKDLFESRVRELYDRISWLSLKRGRDEVRSLAIPLVDRFADLPNPVEACIHAVRTHGVIEHDVSRSGYYRFSHKSFCEVLAAEALKNSILTDDDRSAAIELANSISLIELANQPQIVEFVADFLAGGNGGAGELSYVDIYRRVFPSPFGQPALVRIRSCVSAAIFLFSSSNFRIIGLLCFLMLPMVVFSVYFFTNSGLELLMAMGPRSTVVCFFGYAMVVTFIHKIILDYKWNNRSKFNFLWRLCHSFERNGRRMYASELERAAHRLAAKQIDSFGRVAGGGMADAPL